MDKPIRKYVLYKARNLREMKKELKRLKEVRQDIIDSSPLPPDGQPKGKGGTSNPVESKVLRLEKLNFRCDKLAREIEAIEGTRDLLDKYQQEIFDETVIKFCDLTAKSDLLQIPIKRLHQERGKIVRLMAERLGEYIEDKDE